MYDSVQIPFAALARLPSRSTTQEYEMKWDESMRSEAAGASPEGLTTDRGDPQRANAASWDPFEVWLTRVKEPGDRAARLARARTPDAGAE